MARGIRKLLPKPPPMPDGHMLFYRMVVPIEYAERHADMMMKGFDALPPATRHALNCAPMYPREAGPLVGRYGDAGAAERILKERWKHVFKTPDGRRPHP
jgi:hypothetical protein